MVNASADVAVDAKRLYLGGKGKASSIPVVVERLDAEAIASHEQRLIAGVPNREGEHTAK